MKRLENYTNEELANLNEDEINNLIDVECMCDGVPLSIVPVPVLKELPEIEEPKSEVFTVDNYSFTDKSEADALSELIQNAKSRVVVDYDYNVGSQYKKFKEYSVDNYNRDGFVKKSVVYSLSDYNKIKDVLKTRKQLEDYNSEKKNEYNKLMSERKDVVNRVYDAIGEAVDEVRKINEAVDIYNKYIELADGDIDIAKKFFEQNSRVSEYLEEVLNKTTIK